jgi:hypothetical protein
MGLLKPRKGIQMRIIFLSFILPLTFLATAHADTSDCLSKLSKLKLRRSVSDGNGMSGVSTLYLSSENMIISSYYDPKSKEKRIIAHKNGGSVDLGGRRIIKKTSRAESVHSILAEIIDQNSSSSYSRLKKGSKSSRAVPKQDVLDLISKCEDIENSKVQSSLNQLARSWGLGKNKRPNTGASKGTQ